MKTTERQRQFFRDCDPPSFVFHALKYPCNSIRSFSSDVQLFTGIARDKKLPRWRRRLAILKLLWVHRDHNLGECMLNLSKVPSKGIYSIEAVDDYSGDPGPTTYGIAILLGKGLHGISIAHIETVELFPRKLVKSGDVEGLAGFRIREMSCRFCFGKELFGHRMRLVENSLWFPH